MRQQIVTKAIVLTRTDYQEADRILTLLTPDHGKLTVIAKGVRRARSKLAGGIELLSVNDVTVLPGRGEMGTLISSRLSEHFPGILKDIKRTMLAYELIKHVHKITEQASEAVYFDLLIQSFRGLHDDKLSPELTELWFWLRLFDANGNSPNLHTDNEGQKFKEKTRYIFDFDRMAFQPQSGAPYGSKHIKLLRLTSQLSSPLPLKNLQETGKAGEEVLRLIKLVSAEHM